MDAIQSIEKYFYLYFKSLAFVWKASRINVFLMLLTVPLQALLPSLTILMTNKIINSLSLSKENNITSLLIIWGLFFLFSNVTAPFNTMIQGKLTDLLTYKLNFSIMEKSSQLQTIDYFENNEFYNDIQILSSEASWRPVNLLVFGTSILSNFILFCSMLWLFWGFHFIIAFAMIVALIPHGLISYKIQRQAFETLVSNSEESRKLEYYTKTVLSAESIKDIRLYNLYSVFLNKYTSVFNDIRKSVQNNRVKQFSLSFLFLIMTALFSVGSFWYIVSSVNSSHFPIGSILVFSTSVVYAVNSITRLVEESSLLYDTLLYMDKFFKFMSIKNQDIGKDEVDTDFNTIEFRNIHFSYPSDDKIVLDGVNFTVKKGEKIAIVGENGAGKSTLVKLLCRFYNMSSGDILLDGKSIFDYKPNSYRNLISAIFQDFSKFNLSIRENISLSDSSNRNDSEIRDAMLDSGLEVELMQNLDLTLGKIFEGSRDLSGGQWQKIALARAFYSNCPILVLDEPTAAIDAKTEYHLFQHFLELTRNKTVFYITHRLSSVRQADKILVLRDGKVYGYGTHKDLMNHNSYYRDMYEMQSSLYFKDN